MKKTRLFLLVSLLLASIVPVAALAATPHIGPSGLTGPFITCSGNPGQSGIPACTSLCDVVSTFQNILYFIINLSLFVLGPIMFIYGAVQVFLGAANESWVSKGKSIMMDTVIGLVIVLASFAIINTFFYVVGAKLGSGKGEVHWPQVQCNGKDLPGYIDSSFYNKVPIPGQQTAPSSTGGTNTSVNTGGPLPSSCSASDQCQKADKTKFCYNGTCVTYCGANNNTLSGVCANGQCVQENGKYHCKSN